MKTAMATTVSRRAWLSRLFMAAAMAPVVGATLADTVGADKKGKTNGKSIKERVNDYVRTCARNGGTATVTERPGGTTVACTGTKTGDFTCTVTSKKDRCHASLTNPPTAPLDDVSTPPTGGTEDPTNGGGGTNAGGGAHVPPSGGVDQSGGGSDPVLE